MSIIGQYGFDPFDKESEALEREAWAIISELSKDRDGALEMLRDAEKNDPETFRLVAQIYSIWTPEQESPDRVIEPAMILTLLRKKKGNNT